MIIFFGIEIKFLRSSDIVVRVTGIAQLPHCLLYSSVLKMSIMKKLPSPPQKNKIIYK